MNTPSRADVNKFRRKIFTFYRLHKRNLPFRHTTDPYKITVAEIMLQQTQVDRVVPKYISWTRRWPSWNSLSRATNKQLLKMWSGLGYNRRAVNLGNMAKMVVMHYNGQLPRDENELKKFPGIGPYTARAILIFAFNAPLITIDTNIRRVILHEFNLPATLSQNNLEKVTWQLFPRKKSRDWHNALMDYSRLRLPAHLPRLPARTTQTSFKGSIRQIRGEIIRQLLKKKSVTLSSIAKRMGRTATDVTRAARQLKNERMIKMKGSIINLEN